MVAIGMGVQGVLQPPKKETVVAIEKIKAIESWQEKNSLNKLWKKDTKFSTRVLSWLSVGSMKEDPWPCGRKRKWKLSCMPSCFDFEVVQDTIKRRQVTKDLLFGNEYVTVCLVGRHFGKRAWAHQQNRSNFCQTAKKCISQWFFQNQFWVSTPGIMIWIWSKSILWPTSQKSKWPTNRTRSCSYHCHRSSFWTSLATSAPGPVTTNGWKRTMPCSPKRGSPMSVLKSWTS